MEKYSDTELKTYVVWLPILPSDNRGAWSDELITQPGVQHFWDQKRVSGKWITKNVDACVSIGPVAWDSFYLFDGSAEWNDELGPMIACGAPVIVNAGTLAAEAEKLLKK